MQCINYRIECTLNVLWICIWWNGEFLLYILEFDTSSLHTIRITNTIAECLFTACFINWIKLWFLPICQFIFHQKTFCQNTICPITHFQYTVKQFVYCLNTDCQITELPLNRTSCLKAVQYWSTCYVNSDRWPQLKVPFVLI